MGDETKASDRRRLFNSVGIPISGLPLLYVLGFGQAVILAIKRSSLEDPVLVSYFPVVWLHEHTILRGPIEAYASF
jgi:hypothetical protein